MLVDHAPLQLKFSSWVNACRACVYWRTFRTEAGLDSEKNFDDVYNRFHTIPSWDGQMDRRMEISCQYFVLCTGHIAHWNWYTSAKVIIQMKPGYRTILWIHTVQRLY